MGCPSTYVLDTATGKPVVGMRIDFSVREGAGFRLLRSLQTNADGRTDEPLMSGDAMRAGQFELLFYVADYFRGAGMALPQPAFLDRVPIHFGIHDTQAHYHVPLLCSPWSYTTYRGS
jgi:5-hydroxyisourate hydrolase